MKSTKRTLSFDEKLKILEKMKEVCRVEPGAEFASYDGEWNDELITEWAQKEVTPKANLSIVYALRVQHIGKLRMARHLGQIEKLKADAVAGAANDARIAVLEENYASVSTQLVDIVRRLGTLEEQVRRLLHPGKPHISSTAVNPAAF